MPDAVTVAANKAKSEARKLLMQLQMSGRTNVDIARALGIEPAKLSNIRKGATRGDDLVAPLRSLVAQLVTRPPANPTGGTTEATPATEDSVMAAGADVLVAPPSVGALPVDVAGAEAPAAEEPEKAGLIARFKGMLLGGDGTANIVAPVASGGGKSKSDLQNQFVAQVLPIVAIVIAWGSELAIHDPYKPCAPTVDEAKAIMLVPLRRLARELDVRGRLTAGTMDALLMLLAVAAYGKRAHATYKEIRDANAVESGAGRAGAGVVSGPGTVGGYGAGTPTPADVVHGAAPVAAQPARRGGLFARSGGRPGNGGAAQHAGGPVRGAAGGDAASNTGGSADVISQLLADDYEGRKRLGMVG